MASQRIDFNGINRLALKELESLLKAWLPDGRLEGSEYKARNPTRADARIGSFSISIAKGVWRDFASGDSGSDPVSLYAFLFCSGDQAKAARELATHLRIDESKSASSGKRPAQRSPWVAVVPAPESAPPPPKAHIKRGHPQRTWRYLAADGRTIGYVYLFTTSDGGKEVLPLCWAKHRESGAEKWCWLSFPTPRPLYGLDRLAEDQDKPVLVTEGEKCADAAATHLPEFVSMTWPGGSNAVAKCDWSPLAGRAVIIWPDADAQRDKTGELLPADKQPGMVAAENIASKLAQLGCSVSIVDIPAPGTKPGGWDVADAIDEGLQGPRLAGFIRENLRVLAPADTGCEAASLPAAEGWETRLLERNGKRVDCLANCFQVLTRSEEWAGVLAFNEFAQRIEKLRAPPWEGGTSGEWEAADDSHAAMWITWKYGMTPSTALVAESVEVVARRNTIHPVRDWLSTLPPWDGTDRLDYWLSDFLGTERNDYTMRVGRYFLIGMVARVMRPGCKFDYCLVLEGAQGIGKSSSLSVLAGDWFGDTDLDLHNKDSILAIVGKWLYELAELGAIAHAEAARQKSFLPRRVDEVRPPYGRRFIRCPRQVVFAGTTNDWEWNKDPTGGRRFWPVRCDCEINLDGLRAARPSLFAEALARYKAGEQFWPTQDEQRDLFDPEQLKRELQESLVDALHDWVYSMVRDFSLAEAVTEGLRLDASKLTRDLQTRVGIALRKLGCTKVERRNGTVRYWYRPPGFHPKISNCEASHNHEGEMGGFS